MRDHGKEYGMNRSFNDDELFDKIAALTYPEIRTFFRNTWKAIRLFRTKIISPGGV